MSDGYELGADLPSGGPTRVPHGTNLLVTGPPMAGKRRLVLELLAAGRRRGDGGLFVTTETPHGRVAESYARVADGDGPAFRIVDAVGERGGREVDERYAVEFVGSPGDLTGIGIGMNKALDAFEAEGVHDVRVALDSLSTMLTYLDAERVFKFLHLATGRVASTGGLGVYTLNTAGTDSRVLGMLRNTVDGVVRLDDDGEGGEVTVSGATNRAVE